MKSPYKIITNCVQCVAGGFGTPPTGLAPEYQQCSSCLEYECSCEHEASNAGITVDEFRLNNELYEEEEKDYSVIPPVPDLYNYISSEIDRYESNVRLDEQCFNEITESLTSLCEKLSKVQSVPFPDELFYHVEGVGILLTGLFNSSNVLDASAHILAYARSVTKSSVVESIKELLIENALQTQSFGSDDWLSLLRASRQNWKLVVGNTHFENLQRVLSIIVSLNLCDAAKLDFSIYGMKLFSVKTRAKQATAFDLIDAIIISVTTFIEGGFECFRTKSPMPLLYGDVELMRLREECELCEKLFEFAKTGDLEKSGVAITQPEFLVKIEECIDKLKNMLLTAKGQSVITMLNIKLEKLLRNKTTFERICNKSGLRVSPWQMLVYGDSGVGKSSVANILMVMSLLQNNFPAGDMYLIYDDEFDAYDSTLKSFVTGIFFDDICNTKSDFQKVNPCARIISTKNNARCFGNMAEADEKGKILKEPKVSVLTTNQKNLDSTVYSNNPLSIERRNDYIVTVKVRKKFADVNGMLDQKKVVKYFKDQGMEGIPVVPDLWLFSVEKPCGKIVNGKVSQTDVVYLPMKYEGKKLINVDIKTLLRFNRDESDAHFKAQKIFVDNNTNLAEKVCMCQKCRLPRGEGSDLCECPPEKEEEQFGALIAGAIAAKVTSTTRRTKTWWEKWEEVFECAVLGQMERRLNWLTNSPYATWTNYIPERWLNDSTMKEVILSAHYEDIARNIRGTYLNLILSAIFCIAVSCICPILLPFTLLAFCRIMVLMAQVMEAEKDRLYQTLCEENKSMDVIFRKYRDDFVGYITAGSILLGSIYTVACVWKHLRAVELIPQGELEPKSEEEVEARDKEGELEKVIAKEQGWDQVSFAPIPCTIQSQTSTAEQLSSKVWTNLTQFTCTIDGVFSGCDMFFVDANIAIIPQHMWKKSEMTITIYRGTNTIQSFQSIISQSHSVQIPNTDLSLVYIPNAGSWADLSPYFPEGQIEEGRNVVATCMYKEMRGVVPERSECKTTLSFQKVKFKTHEYNGARYELAWDTFSGLCMAPFVSHGSKTMILGFHTAGIAKTKKGAMCSITRPMYMDAKKELMQLPAVCIAASQGNMNTSLYGKKFFKGQTLHEKSPLHTLPTDAHLDVYGSCIGESTYYSNVIDTPIAQDVFEVCDYKKTYGPPKFRKGNPWKKSIDVSSKPSLGVEPSLLNKAVLDYVNPLIVKTHSIAGLREFVRPLNDLENINGIPGKRFIDQMAPNTSVGYPEGGSKLKYLSPIEDLPTYLNDLGIFDEEYIEHFNKHACDMKQLDDKYLSEMRNMENEYLQGRRCHVAFKACLKDEPTKLIKDKVRVFQAAPIALQLCIRKYYLPVVRLLSIFPLSSECGVGINSIGPEFSSLVDFMKKYGDDRILAGDYSKYDLRMPAQLVLAAFDVLHRMAQSYGYSEDHLTIMRGIATDIAYPVMAYNGDLVQHIGSNPSGQNLTVYINSIVNSLLLRSAFFHLYKDEEVPPFREVAAMMTYGDDVKGSVHPQYDKFNHISYADFLKERDIVFTMPDKESEPTKYMHHKEADFLKRRDTWNEDFNLWFGALDEDSLFKSLTSIKKSKAVEPIEQSMMNIDGALREWFLHGRDVYEKRRAQMRIIADRHSITGGCKMLSKSYDDCCDDYARRYHLVRVEKNPSIRSDSGCKLK